jgi:hypothetical protein
MKRAHIILAVGFFLVGFSGLLHSQSVDQLKKDYVFALTGNWQITSATGIPYIGIGEFAYGINSRTTLGLVYGITPNVEGYGLRGRRILYQSTEDFRLYFCVPVLYYPKTRALGGEPWFLTRPNINFEWITKKSLRYKVGGSLIAAASQPSLFGKERFEEGFKGGLWNAVHAGLSFPIIRNIMFQTELSVVMNGIHIAGKDWVGGPPVILVIGISYGIN